MKKKRGYTGLRYKAVNAFDFGFGVLSYKAQINLHDDASSAISRPPNERGESVSRRSEEISVWDSKKK